LRNIAVHVIAFIIGLFCCLGVALDAFQTIVLPRRPTGRLQITRIFLIATWAQWVAIAERARNPKVRDQIYSIYGPLSLLMLVSLWAILLVFGFGMFYFSMGSQFGDMLMNRNAGTFGQLETDLYVSGTTLFTLGLGDVVPHSLHTRALIIIESGVGLGFVALVISYLPVLYQAFSRREVNVALLDSRAGSPPNAAELFRRHAFEGGQEALTTLLAEWERWSAEILESHVSYPILCYYRSQHDNQSWLSALVSILDTCSLLIAVVQGDSSRQAQLTFVMARHALVDLNQVFQKKGYKPNPIEVDRLPSKDFYRLCEALGNNKLLLCGDPAAARRLDTIRALYEPQAVDLSKYLQMSLPVWVAPPKDHDQWSVLTRLRTDAETAVKIRDVHAVSLDDD
jgi:Ion channel